MNSLPSYIIVFLGGGLGALLRHGVNRFALSLNSNFPYHTLAINVLGCFIMGLLASWFAFRGEDSTQPLRLFLTTGILGGFTTFSAFSLDTALLWERGEPTQAALYVLGSVILSLVAVFAGLAISRSIFV